MHIYVAYNHTYYTYINYVCIIHTYTHSHTHTYIYTHTKRVRKRLTMRLAHTITETRSPTVGRLQAAQQHKTVVGFIPSPKAQNLEPWRPRKGGHGCSNSSKRLKYPPAPSAFLLWSAPQLRPQVGPLVGEVGLLDSVYTFKWWSLPQSPSQTLPEIIFYQLAECPLTQSTRHIKLIVK